MHDKLLDTAQNQNISSQIPPGCRVFTKSMVLRTSLMVGVKENSNGAALLGEKGMVALIRLIVSSVLENGGADAIDRLLRPVVREEQIHGQITL